MEVVNKLRLTVDFGKRYLCAVQGEWGAGVRNGENRRVLPLFPTARVYAKLEDCVAKLGNFEIEVLADREYCDSDFEVGNVPNS